MTQPKQGVLLVNLGTPEEPTPKAVKAFLKAFLSDKRVIDLPRLLWLPILYGIILTFRPKKVAKNYAKIWTEEGSPLMKYCRMQQLGLQQLFDQQAEGEYRVELAMTYGEPSISGRIQALEAWGANKITVIPLYPQFSHTTTACVTDQIYPLLAEMKPEVSVISDYHDDADYIDALALSVGDTLKTVDKLVMSFHGVPKRYITSGDPYQAQCLRTAELLARRLNLPAERWEVAYQSRVGKEEWLTPYLDQRMSEIAAEGSKKIAVICPGFAVDCLETLEEIAMENKEIFMENGGESFVYIDALNAEPAHIEMLYNLARRNLESDFIER